MSKTMEKPSQRQKEKFDTHSRIERQTDRRTMHSFMMDDVHTFQTRSLSRKTHRHRQRERENTEKII